MESQKRKECVQKICEALSANTPRSVAAKSVGISARTLSRWIADDEEIKTKIEQAEAEAQVKIFKNLTYLADTLSLAALKQLSERITQNDDTVERILDVLEQALPAEYYQLALDAIEESDL